jgi:GrpB-like predicted nucleotidyltransferase (UPF0157 family)
MPVEAVRQLDFSANPNAATVVCKPELPRLQDHARESLHAVRVRRRGDRCVRRVGARGVSARAVVWIIAGTAPERSAAAAGLATRIDGAVHVAGDVASADARAAAGTTVVLEVDLAAAALGGCRAAIAHRPCHLVVVTADADTYAAGAARAGVWVDPRGLPPAGVVEAVAAAGRADPAPIAIVDYDPRWPELFERLAAPLRHALAGLGASLEHVGSTSVPGLAAKPVIDIDVIVAAPGDVPPAIERLRGLGYVYQGDKGVPGREAFLWPPALREHHVYVVVEGSPPHLAHVRFRDLLRERRDLVCEYANLKRALAARHGADRLAYTEAKSDFVMAVLMESARL